MTSKAIVSVVDVVSKTFEKVDLNVEPSLIIRMLIIVSSALR